MLLHWKQHYGSSAEFQTLAADGEHPLVQRRDVAYKYCYITTGCGQIGRELHTRAWKDSASLKIGIPSNEDLEGVTIEIQDGWMKLGRYFGLKRSVLCNINEEEKFPSEKCYQMLLYCKQHYGSSAEFKTLAAGLEHPLVQRRDLAYKYCYITTGFGQIGRELRTTSL